jgi:hypothetical protein
MPLPRTLKSFFWMNASSALDPIICNLHLPADRLKSRVVVIRHYELEQDKLNVTAKAC